MEILALFQLLLPVLISVLSTEGVISPNMSDLVTKLGQTVPTLIQSLLHGGGVTVDVLASLQAVQVSLEAVKTDTTVSPTRLQLVLVLEPAIADAVEAYQESAKTDDPSTLTRLPETTAEAEAAS